MAKISITIDGSLGDPEMRALIDRLVGDKACGCKDGAHYIMTAEECRKIEAAAGELTGFGPLPAVTVTEVPPAAEPIMPTRQEVEQFFAEPEIDPAAALGAPVAAEAFSAPPPVVPPTEYAVAPPAPTVDLDGEGLPWDKRIHASTKTRRQSDNTWKLLKGIDPALVEQVKAELRAAMGAPVPAPAPPAPAPTAAFLAGAAAPIAALGMTPVTAPTTFPDLIRVITSRQQAGTLTVADVQACCQKHGLASLNLLASRPDLIPAVHRELEAICHTAQ